MSIESLIQPHLLHMQPYTPIVPLDILSAQLGIAVEKLIKLDANENAYGASPRAIEAMAHAHDLHIYPDPDQTHLRQAIASYVNVPAQHIVCGAGADEVIQMIGQLFIANGDGLLDLPPTFGMYKWLADVMHARYSSIPRKENFELDLDAIEAQVRGHGSNIKLLFVSNPNNPDGSVITDAALQRLLRLPLVVVLDEAYIEFSTQPSRANWVAQHDNLIVLRTFSKVLGMAGMRIGYGVLPLNLIKHVWKIKQPYTPTVASSVGAIAALQDQAYLQDTVQRMVRERERMSQALRDTGWLQPYPSQANFVLCRVLGKHAKQLKTDLAAHGILVRYFDKDNLRDCIRISVGKPEQTDTLMAVLQQLKPT